MAYAKQMMAERFSSVEMIAARLQTIIRSRSAQEAQCAVVYRRSDEDPKDWDQIIAAIDETDGVHVATHDDGSAHISWDVPDTAQRAGMRVSHLKSPAQI
ncbi:DUF1654 domain-containing protein [Pseudomonas viridiflava]|uniref:DUF1654 domain-containing protein n=1 Tax=Pseudomonas viridiflava TaxID=33069 RepID=UPI002EACC03B|nr:DUF1654 domain-containing protein [Pseudomonas viridiflava]MEE3972358.1 DUF1654 domain-containing protein [Pseudomonas viridiflava]MEE4017199.1 DUF1654 domain-containing protein [Pseudomonas viridiflava]MEE4046165.1 DUF1654 domain-containing protein [Pseudomonas viridiflava]